MRGRERMRGRGEEDREEKGRRGKGEGRAVEGKKREGKNDLTHPLSQIPVYAAA